MFALRRVGAVVLLAGLITGLASPAAAQGPVEDPRATQHDGNVVFEPGGRDDCPTLWPGSTGVTLVDADPSSQYIDVLAIPAGVEVVGVIVKGGDRYNRYDADALGDLPWLNLYSPLNNGGKIPDVSHWFACGTRDQTTTTTTTTTTDATTTTTTVGTGTTTTTTTATSGQTTTTETAPVTTTAPVTETSPVPVPGGGGGDDLAETGANTGWLPIAGLLLLIAGGLALIAPRVRTALSRR